jgi:hypothetical protein
VEGGIVEDGPGGCGWSAGFVKVGLGGGRRGFVKVGLGGEEDSPKLVRAGRGRIGEGCPVGCHTAWVYEVRGARV